MKKRVISFMMSAVLTLSGLGCYGLANVHAETDTNVERKLKIFAHYAEAEAALEKKYEEMLAAGEEIPEDEESLIHTGRAERLYPGEGEIDIAGVLKKVPQASRGIEVPHLERVKELGLTEHARRALEYAKKNFDQI